MKTRVNFALFVATAFILAIGVTMWRLLREERRAEGGIHSDPNLRMDAPPPESGPPSQRLA